MVGDETVDHNSAVVGTWSQPSWLPATAANLKGPWERASEPGSPVNLQ